MIDAIRILMADTGAMLILPLDIAFKATILLILAWFLHALAGQRRALLRSALWNACLVGLLLVPLACIAFPRLKLPVLALPANVAASQEDAIRTVVKPKETALGNPDDAISNRPVIVAPAAPSVHLGFEIENAQVTESRAIPTIDTRSKWWPDVVYIGLGFYLAVVSLHLLRLILSLRAVRSLERNCIPVDEPDWVEGLARGRERLGIGRSVRLLRSEGVSVPIVVGWLRPAIILPESLAGSANPGLIDAVLLHELAHIRRGDFIWNCVRRIVQALYWPHPLVWPLGWVIGSVREQACDDLCVHVLGGPDGYHDSLVEVAAGLVCRPEPALGMAMARSTALARRIAWIHRTRGASDCILPRPARLTLALAIVSFAGLIGSVELARATGIDAEPEQEPKAEKVTKNEEARPDSKPDSKPESGPKSELPKAIDITVLAQDTGKPMADVEISGFIDRKMKLLRTDQEGKARIDLAGAEFLDILSFDVFVEGYVQQRFAYSKYEADKPPLPAQLQVNLRPGEETLGGKVVDEQGQPIAGAKVEIWGNVGEKKDPHELVYMIVAKTDAQGRFRIGGLGAEEVVYLLIEGPTVAHTRLPVVTRQIEPLPARGFGNDYGPSTDTIHGADFTFTAAPGRTTC